MNILPGRFYYGWLVAGAASGIQFANAATAIGILTVFVIPMSEEFGWNRTEVAGATSLGAILGAGLAPFSGRLVDRFGARVILVVGGLVVVMGCLYLSAAQALAGFYVAFTAVRIADQGLIQIGASVSVGKWFLRRRGRAVGLVFFGGSVGMIVMAPVVQFVIANWDWRTAWVVLSITMLCIGVIPSALFIRRQPEDMGLAIDGEDTRTPASRGADARRDEPQVPLGEVIRTPAFWVIIVSLFLASSAISGVGLHLVPHLTQQGLSPTAAVAAVSVMAISGAVAALVSGVLAETVSVKLLLILAYLLGAVSMWTLIHADTLAETYLFAVMQGFLGTGVNTLAPIMWASYYGRRSLGGIFGMSRAAQVCGFAVGPLVSAVVFDSTGSYQGAFISLGLVAILSSLLLWATRRPVSELSQPCGLPRP